MRSFPPPLLVLACALAARGAAQCPSSGGPLAGAPVVLSVDPATSFATPRPDQLDLKLPGFGGAVPTPIAGAGLPDFRPAALWYPPGRPCNPTGVIDIDAISIGWDWVPATSTGEVFVAPGNFAAMTFSVTRATRGVPGGVIACEAAGASGAAADVFSYVFLGSALPPEVVDRVFRANDATEIPLPVGPALPDIDSLDHFAALYSLLLSAGVPLPLAVTVYFSLAPASVPLVPPAWWLQDLGGGPVPTAPSAASILRTTWDPLTLAWSCPEVWRSSADLGLLPGENLDALAVDLQQGFVLFSTSVLSAGAPNPLMFGNLATVPLATSVFRYAMPPVPVSSRLELEAGTGDVDGICALDPGGNPLRQGVDPLLTVFGRIENPLLPITNAPAVGAYRTNRSGQDVLRTFTLGGPRPGWSFLFFSPPPPLNQFPFWLPSPVVLVAGTGGSGAQGLPTLLDLAIPPGTHGMALDLHWVDVHQSLGQVVLGNPLTVRL